MIKFNRFVIAEAKKISLKKFDKVTQAVSWLENGHNQGSRYCSVYGLALVHGNLITVVPFAEKSLTK